MSGDVIKKAVIGRDCSGALLEPNANKTVQAEIDDVLEQVRAVCERNSFVALQRNDGAWIFVPILGTDNLRNLCTIWPRTEQLDYVVLGQEEDASQSRKFGDVPADAFRTALDQRYLLLAERWKA